MGKFSIHTFIRHCCHLISAHTLCSSQRTCIPLKIRTEILGRRSKKEVLRSLPPQWEANDVKNFLVWVVKISSLGHEQPHQWEAGLIHGIQDTRKGMSWRPHNCNQKQNTIPVGALCPQYKVSKSFQPPASLQHGFCGAMESSPQTFIATYTALNILSSVKPAIATCGFDSWSLLEKSNVSLFPELLFRCALGVTFHHRQLSLSRYACRYAYSV